MSFKSRQADIQSKKEKRLESLPGAREQIKQDSVGFSSQVKLGVSKAAGAVTTVLGSVANQTLSSFSLPATPGSISSLVSGAIGAPDARGFVPGNTPPPWKNELEPYTSYNTIFTLSVLTPEEINFPDETYRRTDPANVILRTGGGLGSRKVTTAYETNGRVEYYIEDVKIESYVAPNGRTGIANAVGVNFTVREPYSLGLFLQTLKIAALNAGYENYIEAPMLLKIEFVGFNEDNSSALAPYSSRMIPINLVNATVEANEGGSTYQVEAYATNDAAFIDEVQTITNDVSVTGDTLIEICQTGSESLATKINEQYFENEKRGQEVRGDRYIIMFPENTESKRDDYSTTKTEGATVEEDEPADENAAVQQLYAASELSERLAAEAGSNLSDIGRQRMIASFTNPGEMPFGVAGVVYDDEKQIYVRDGIDLQISDDRRKYQFAAGSTIEHMVQQLVILSQHGKELIEKAQNQQGPLIDWFRIESQVYVDPVPGQVRAMGDMPKIYVYRVVPYQIASSFFKGPASATKGLGQLKTQAAKEYNYIYTGKNKDIIDFKLEFNYAFYVNLMSDIGNASLGSRTGMANRVSTTKEQANQIQSGGEEVDEAGEPRIIGTNKTTTQNGTPGSASSDPQTIAATTAHDAFLNSDVDLIQVDLTIMGDPYYVPDSGLGNYVAPDLPGYFNMKEGGSMNYQNGEVDVNLVFRTPIDYNETGTMDFATYTENDTEIIEGFSGLYRIISITHNWEQNFFSQTLKLLRHRTQEEATSEQATPIQPADTPEKSSNQDDPAAKINSADGWET